MYWLLVVNMVAVVQYFVICTFAQEGDVARFIQGLQLSPYTVLIPGLVLTTFFLQRIFRKEIIKAYVAMQIENLFAQKALLLATLFVIFLLIYTHSYNPITDNANNLIAQIIAVGASALVPILFCICSPSRPWVQNAIVSKNKYKDIMNETNQ